MTTRERQRLTYGRIVHAFIRAGWNPPRPDTRIVLAIAEDMERAGAHLERPYNLHRPRIGGVPERARELGMTGQEIRALRLAAEGYTCEEAAEAAGISHMTMKSQLRLARRSLGARNTAHAVAFALREGLIS